MKNLNLLPKYLKNKKLYLPKFKKLLLKIIPSNSHHDKSKNSKVMKKNLLYKDFKYKKPN